MADKFEAAKQTKFRVTTMIKKNIIKNT